MIIAAAPARADWPVARGDLGRTGRADLPVTLTTPQVAWSAFLGGTISEAAFLAGAPAFGPASTLFLVASGRLEQRRADDALVWQTAGPSLSSLVGAFDLDGDGAPELVAEGRHPDGSGAALVIDPATGAVLWASPPGAVGNLTDTTRVLDLDGDGLPDLYFADANATAAGTVAKAAHAYTFADGFPAAAKLWTLATEPNRDYWVALHEAWGDFDGDGAPDLFAQGRDHLYLYDGATGAMKGAPAEVGPTAAARGVVTVTDVDGDGADDAIVFAPGGWSAAFNAVQVSRFSWSPDDGALVQVWQRAADDVMRDQIAFDPSSVVDLDGDGALEVVVSFTTGEDQTWSTEILDAATGALEHTVPGDKLELAHDLDGDGTVELVTRTAEGGARIYHVTAQGPALLGEAPDWYDDAVPRCLVRSPTRPTAAVRRACTLETTAGPALLVGRTGAESGLQDLRALRFDTEPQGGFGAPQVVAAFEPLKGTRLVAWNLLDGLVPGGQAAALVTSNGRLLVLDRDLAPQNFLPTAPQPVLGMRVRAFDPGYGGFARFPVAADLDGVPGDEIVAVTSGERVVVFDATQAAQNGTVHVRWTAPGATTVAIGRGPLGPQVLAAGRQSVRAWDPWGGLSWERSAFAVGVRGLYGDLLAFDLDGDGWDEALFQTRNGKGEQGLVAYGAAAGDTYVDTVIDVNNGGMRRLAAGQLGLGDAPPILVGGPLTKLWVLDAATGAFEMLATVASGVHHLIADVTGDGRDEVLSLGTANLSLHEADGTKVWGVPAPATLASQLGALTPCGYVTSFQHGPTLGALDLDDGGPLWTVALAGGAAYPDAQAAAEAGAATGFLGNVAAAEDAEGNQVAFVGSTDGWLYAVDACSGALAWALEVGAPLREVIVADWAADGDGELVVSATDGSLYGVDQGTIAAPDEVLDLDPPSGVTDADVDDIESFASLYARWDAVPGAIGYEVGVATVDGLQVSDDMIWTDQHTDVAIGGLPLHTGVRYLVGVRAVGPLGKSAVRWSDGVTVVDRTPPTATLSADREGVALGGDPARLIFAAQDKTKLKALRLEVFDAGFASVTVLRDEAAVDAAQRQGEVGWAGTDAFGAPVAPGTYHVVLLVSDYAGHQATAELTLEVVEPPPAPVDEAPDAGSTPPLALSHETPQRLSGPAPAQGCACRGGATDLGGAWWWALVALVLVTRRRR